MAALVRAAAVLLPHHMMCGWQSRPHTPRDETTAMSVRTACGAAPDFVRSLSTLFLALPAGDHGDVWQRAPRPRYAAR
jgi:hypothetical protein